MVNYSGKTSEKKYTATDEREWVSAEKNIWTGKKTCRVWPKEWVSGNINFSQKKNILYLWFRLISSNDSWNWYLEFLEDIFVFLCVQFSRQLESKNFSFGIPFGIYIIFFLNPESRWDSTFLPNCTFFVIKVKSNNFSQSLFESS